LKGEKSKEVFKKRTKALTSEGSREGNGQVLSQKNTAAKDTTGNVTRKNRTSKAPLDQGSISVYIGGKRIDTSSLTGKERAIN